MILCFSYNCSAVSPSYRSFYAALKGKGHLKFYRLNLRYDYQMGSAPVCNLSYPPGSRAPRRRLDVSNVPLQCFVLQEIQNYLLQGVSTVSEKRQTCILVLPSSTIPNFL